MRGGVFLEAICLFHLPLGKWKEMGTLRKKQMEGNVQTKKQAKLTKEEDFKRELNFAFSFH